MALASSCPWEQLEQAWVRQAECDRARLEQANKAWRILVCHAWACKSDLAKLRDLSMAAAMTLDPPKKLLQKIASLATTLAQHPPEPAEEPPSTVPPPATVDLITTGVSQAIARGRSMKEILQNKAPPKAPQAGYGRMPESPDPGPPAYPPPPAPSPPKARPLAPAPSPPKAKPLAPAPKFKAQEALRIALVPMGTMVPIAGTPAPPTHHCPVCRGFMVLHWAHRGGVFWGCQEYSTRGCRGTRGFWNPNSCSPVAEVKYP